MLFQEEKTCICLIPQLQETMSEARGANFIHQLLSAISAYAQRVVDKRADDAVEMHVFLGAPSYTFSAIFCVFGAVFVVVI